jgi:hypothetical protein
MNVRFKVFTAVIILLLFFWVVSQVDWLVQAYILDKCAVSVFRAGVCVFILSVIHVHLVYWKCMSCMLSVCLFTKMCFYEVFTFREV